MGGMEGTSSTLVSPGHMERGEGGYKVKCADACPGIIGVACEKVATIAR